MTRLRPSPASWVDRLRSHRTTAENTRLPSEIALSIPFIDFACRREPHLVVAANVLQGLIEMLGAKRLPLDRVELKRMTEEQDANIAPRRDPGD